MRLLNPHNNVAAASTPLYQSKTPTDDVDEDPEELAFLAGRAAFKYSQQFHQKTRLTLPSQGITRPCEVKWTDIRIGKLLGTGGFCDVKQVEVLHCVCPSKSRWGGKTCSRIRGKNYAVKVLKESVKLKRKSYEEGAVDQVNEAKLLTHLQHENIIRIHGVAHGCPSDSYFQNRSYFVLIELLDETLESMLKRLREEDLKSNTVASLRRLNCASGSRALHATQKSHREERLETIALPLARAMQYLHHKRILYRDLKPSNIGFDANGTLKLYDFGLAREIVDDGRRLTGKTGSIRYMAPEVVKCFDYCFPADVYSFGIFFWEIMTLGKAFDGLKKRAFHNLVVDGGIRPIVGESCGPQPIRTLMQQCWDPSPDNRPSFAHVVKVLSSEAPQSEAPHSKARQTRASRSKNPSHQAFHSRIGLTEAPHSPKSKRVSSSQTQRSNVLSSRAPRARIPAGAPASPKIRSVRPTSQTVFL